jgi:hypothetical protein
MDAGFSQDDIAQTFEDCRFESSPGLTPISVSWLSTLDS